MAGRGDVELVRRGYEAFIAGDMEWLNDHLHDTIVWHVGGTGSLAGDHAGRENVLALFAKGMQLAVPEFDIHDIAQGEDHVVSVLTMTWRKPNGDSFASRAVQVFHLSAEQVLESWFLVEDQAGLDAFQDGA
jgi:uncharacterized protein